MAITFKSQIRYLSNNSSFLHIYVEGSLNKSNFAKFDKICKYLLQNDKSKNIVFTFSHLDSIDSTGIGLLVNFQEQFKQQDIQLMLTTIPQKILHLFEMLGMRTYLDIFATEQDATNMIIRQRSEDGSMLKVTSTEDIVLLAEKETPQDKDRQAKKKAVTEEPTEEVFLMETQEEEEVREEPHKRKLLVKTIKVNKEKAHKSKKSKEQESLVIRLEYYRQMTVLQNFPLKVTIVARKHKEEKNRDNPQRYFEIVPQIPGCLTTPSQIRLEEKDLVETVFFITPIVRSRLIRAEVFIRKKSNVARRIPFDLTIKTGVLPKLSVAIGVLGLLSCILFDTFAFPIREPKSIFAALAGYLGGTLGGTVLGMFVLAIFMGIAMILYDQQRPIKAEPLVHIWDDH